MAVEVFETYESEVRSYCRKFTAVFETAKGSKIWDEEGREYLDFFDGAGAFNYGHNNDYIRKSWLIISKRTALATLWICIQDPSVISSNALKKIF